MKFSELVRLLEQNGFKLIREKGSIRYYGKPGVDRLIRVDYHGAKEVPTGTLQCYSEGCRLEGKIRRDIVIDLKYSLVIEATEDPTFFGFYSPDRRVSQALAIPSRIACIKPSGVWRSILNCSRNSPFLFPQKTLIQNRHTEPRGPSQGQLNAINGSGNSSFRYFENSRNVEVFTRHGVQWIGKDRLTLILTF